MIKRLLRLFGPVLVGLVFLAAVWLLYRELRRYELSQIGARIWEIPPVGFGIAVAMTVVNWLILVGYDYLAVRYVGLALPLRRVAMASFCGYACSYNFGATLAGTTVRLRLYSAWNVPVVKILQLLVILGLTFWFGLFGLAGTVFLVDPPQIAAVDSPPAAAATAPPAAGEAQDKTGEVLRQIGRIAVNMRVWGAVLAALALAYLVLSVARLHEIRIFGHRLPVPPFKLTLYQYAITWADMLVAALVLYCLMYNIPGVGGYLDLLGIYLLVYVAVVLSHVPGGYGVFDAGMVYCLHLSGGDLATDRVFAAILVFRVIYFWIPLLLAIALLSVNEWRLRRRAAEGGRQ